MGGLSRAVAVAVVLVCLVRLTTADTITLRSGNGVVGGLDSEVTMLVGPAEGTFGGPFGPAHFAAALSGPSAFISAPGANYLSHLPVDPAAEWLTTRYWFGPAVWSDTALFAIQFDAGTSPIAHATMDFHFVVDNNLGDDFNEGLFLNEVPILGTRLGGEAKANFEMPQSFLGLDVSSHVKLGLNTLYIYQYDHNGPSGLMFSATIEITTAVPLPAAAWLGLGLLTILGAARRRRRRAART